MAVTADANVTFWYGCNMTRHGEIVRLVTQMLEAVGVAAAPAGGPGYCCGSPQESNARIAAGMAARTVEKFNAAGRETVVTWCPSCHMNMDDFMAPVTEAAFETQHITQLLAARAERLRPLLIQPVAARVLLHAHHGFHGRVPVNTDVPMLLGMIPGLTVLDHPLRVPAICARDRRGAGRIGPRTSRDAGGDRRGGRGHAGDGLPLVPSRGRGAGARPANPRGELDLPAGRSHGAAVHRRLQAVAQCGGRARPL